MVVEVTGDTEGLSRNLEKGSRSISRFTGDIERRLSQIDSRLTTFGRGMVSGLVGGITAAGVVTSVRNALRDAGQLQDISEKIGISAEKLQELRFGAEETGSSISTMDEALAKFSVRLADARQGNGELAKVLGAFNIQLTDSAGNARSMEAVMRDVADAVKAVQDPTEQLNIVTAAFGQGAGELVNLLRQGSKGLDEMATSARNAGQVLDDELVQRSAEINDRFERLSRTISITFKGAILEIVDVLNNIHLFDSWETQMKRFEQSMTNYSPIPKEQFSRIPKSARYPKTLDDVLAQQRGDTSGAEAQKMTALRLQYFSSQSTSTSTTTLGNSPLRMVKKETDDLSQSIADANDRAEDFSNTLADGFAGAIVNGRRMNDVLKETGLNLFKIGLEAAKPALLNLFGGAGGSVSAGGIPIPGRKPSQGGFLDSLIGGVKSIFGFADGGVMTPYGPLPLRKYAAGGVANSPQVSVFGEGRMAEAYVPLQDGRSIPVTMRGGGGGVSVNQMISIDARGADEGFTRKWPALEKELIRKTKQAVASETARGGSYAKTVGRR